MLVNTPRDLFVFFGVFVSGVCIGAVFDVFRALRKAYPPGVGFLSFQDALFCGIAFFIFSHTVSEVADGDLRWFVFAGLCSGLVLYFLTACKFVLWLFTHIFMAVRKITEAVTDVTKKLFCYISAPFKCVFDRGRCVFFSAKGKMIKKFKKIFTTGKK